MYYKEGGVTGSVISDSKVNMDFNGAPQGTEEETGGEGTEAIGEGVDQYCPTRPVTITAVVVVVVVVVVVAVAVVMAVAYAYASIHCATRLHITNDCCLSHDKCRLSQQT